MLAVRRAYRNHKLGFKLKLAQRERVLAQGIKRITWTFDPLQCLNAHLNFGRLGVIADKYKTNFYGEVTSSFLHQIGTDRLWVTWLIDSQRVRDRLQTDEVKSIAPDDLAAVVRVSSGCEPDTSHSSDLIGSQRLSIEIPWNINDIQRDQPQLAANWRAATRAAFTSAINADYLVSDFYRATRNDRSVGVYLLTLKEESE